MDFRSKASSYAKIVGKEYNILPSFILGVAFLETGGGKSKLCLQANNLFSIKGSYKGKSIVMNTVEYDKGQPYKVNAKFRKYPTYKESFEDFCDLIQKGVSWNRNLYAGAVIGKTNITDLVTSFAKTPYMTDPHYASKLLGVIKSYKLTEFDAPEKKSVQATQKMYKSIVDYLKAKGVDSSFENRVKLAKRYGIQDYTGTVEQNTKLLMKLQEDEL